MRSQQIAAQRGRPRGDLPALIHELGLEQGVLNQPWTELSVRHACADMFQSAQQVNLKTHQNLLCHVRLECVILGRY